MRISDWSSDVCSSDLRGRRWRGRRAAGGALDDSGRCGDTALWAGRPERGKPPRALRPSPAFAGEGARALLAVLVRRRRVRHRVAIGVDDADLPPVPPAHRPFDLLEVPAPPPAQRTHPP